MTMLRAPHRSAAGLKVRGPPSRVATTVSFMVVPRIAMLGLAGRPLPTDWLPPLLLGFTAPLTAIFPRRDGSGECASKAQAEGLSPTIDITG
jgi:hypothetical protein